MAETKLRFVVASDRTLDYDLIEEAWRGDQQVADIRHVNNVWQVTFFPNERFCEVTWQEFNDIYQEFAKFKAEQSS